MRMPPLPADSIHARACKLKCEKILTRPEGKHRIFTFRQNGSAVIGYFVRWRRFFIDYFLRGVQIGFGNNQYQISN